MFRKVDHQINFNMYLMLENMKNCHINKFLTISNLQGWFNYNTECHVCSKKLLHRLKNTSFVSYQMQGYEPILFYANKEEFIIDIVSFPTEQKIFFYNTCTCIPHWVLYNCNSCSQVKSFSYPGQTIHVWWVEGN